MRRRGDRIAFAILAMIGILAASWFGIHTMASFLRQDVEVLEITTCTPQEFLTDGACGIPGPIRVDNLVVGSGVTVAGSLCASSGAEYTVWVEWTSPRPDWPSFILLEPFPFPLAEGCLDYGPEQRIDPAQYSVTSDMLAFLVTREESGPWSIVGHALAHDSGVADYQWTIFETQSISIEG